jgi:hypothetical protein
MLGSIIVFLIVCGIVAAYMAIVHSFLREAEQFTEVKPKISPPPGRQQSPEAHMEESRDVHWAH